MPYLHERTHTYLFLTIIYVAGKGTSWWNPLNSVFREDMWLWRDAAKKREERGGRDGARRRHRWKHSSSAAQTQIQTKMKVVGLGQLRDRVVCMSCTCSIKKKQQQHLHHYITTFSNIIQEVCCKCSVLMCIQDEINHQNILRLFLFTADFDEVSCSK